MLVNTYYCPRCKTKSSLSLFIKERGKTTKEDKLECMQCGWYGLRKNLITKMQYMNLKLKYY